MLQRRDQFAHGDSLLLPPCDGPKLHQFEDPQPKIKWIQRLDENRQGNEGFVFQVEIASHKYALKIFKFTDPRDHLYYWQSGLHNELSLKEALYYTDPFHAECRAYGRIKEGHTSRVVLEEPAVKCYGYLLLNLNQEDRSWLQNAGVDLEVDILDHELHEALGGDLRIRAIVKHLEREPMKIDARNVHRALKNVYILNDFLKVYNMDIKVDNFIGPRLVDFGSSWTEPHVFLKYFDEVDPAMALTKRMKDKASFADMIQKDDIQARLRSKYQHRRKGLLLGRKSRTAPYDTARATKGILCNYITKG